MKIRVTQLCLFCRGEGLVCVESEGDLGTFVECGYCDSLSDKEEEYDTEKDLKFREEDYY